MSMELEDLNDSFSVIIQPEPWFACLYNEITTTFSAIRRSGTVSTCTPSEWSHQCTASDMTWQMLGGLL